ncbi:MAG: HAMP domain-containing protein [Deltaproteobacteria bacterium]|nr:HAMP domain-containing protein [Deltaproteobacteria bacterium]MDQ3296756.1 ATP-binding protein [Myxococcota bacterium]
MRSSLRNRLLITFLLLVVVVGTGTLFAIERTLADDLVASLDARLTKQGKEVAEWLRLAGHPDRLAPRLARVTGTRITIIGADGLIQGDSLDRATVGRPIGEAQEVARARRGKIGRAIRRLRSDEPQQYLVALPADLGRVIRLAVPLGDVIETRARMRNRLLVGGGFGLVGCLLLSWIFIRAVTRPLQSMTRTAEKLARGNYDAPPPIDSGGELGVLARAMNHMAAEVKGRIGELTQQRDLLSVVFGGLVEGVVVVDRSGTIVLVNDAAKPMLDDPTSLPAPILPLVTRALAGEQADDELELMGRAVRASARPLGDPGPEWRGRDSLPAPGAIVVLYDVTRMRALESVRREFLSNAAHELRTPVTSIAGYAETLLGSAVDAATSKEFLQTIQRNASRIASLVNDLVLLDTLGGRATAIGERTRVSLAQVVQDAVLTARGVTPDAQIAISVPDLAVLATRDGLDHVVQNLIDNAIKYGGGTPVSVTAEVVGAHVQLAVADRGPGIPRGQEERIFERFYRIDAGRSRERGGSGLGLAIVKSQIEALGGRVWVEDNQPGARFVVELDLSPASPRSSQSS